MTHRWNGKVLIAELVIIFFVMSKEEWFLLFLWILPFMMLEMSFHTGNEGLYLEVIDDYPKGDCMKPMMFKFWFKCLDKPKGVPKAMYYEGVIRLVGFGIYSALFWLLILLDVDANLVSTIGRIYISWEFMVIFYSTFVVLKKAFLARYKRLNRYNFKYLGLKENEPYPKRIGKCKIIQEQKRGRKTYVTVSIIETGEIKRKVLLPGKKRTGKDQVYSLYEICKVYYIV